MLAGGLMVLLLAPTSGLAQRSADARTALRNTRGAPAMFVVAIRDTTVQRRDPDVVRFLVGVAGFVVGTYVWYSVADAAMGPCNCDDPGLEAFIYGFLLGGPTGTGLGVSAISFDSPCPYTDRFLRALGGSVAGTGVGVVLGLGTEGYGFVAAPFLASLGATVLQGRC